MNLSVIVCINLLTTSQQLDCMGQWAFRPSITCILCGYNLHTVMVHLYWRNCNVLPMISWDFIIWVWLVSCIPMICQAWWYCTTFSLSVCHSFIFHIPLCNEISVPASRRLSCMAKSSSLHFSTHQLYWDSEILILVYVFSASLCSIRPWVQGCVSKHLRAQTLSIWHTSA